MNRGLDSANVTRQVAESNEQNVQDLNQLADELSFDELEFGEDSRKHDYSLRVAMLTSQLHPKFRESLLDQIYEARNNHEFSVTFRDTDGAHVTIEPHASGPEQFEQKVYLDARSKVFNLLQAELAGKQYDVTRLSGEEGLEYITGFTISW